MTHILSPTSSEGSLSSEFLVISHPPSSVHGSSSHLNDLHLSIYTAQADMSPDEIQQKVRDLLRENLELKETLHQNNRTMQDQFQKLVKWQNEVAQVHHQQYSKMEEVRTVIQKLREEKEELQNKITNYDEKLKDFDTLKDQVAELESVKENLHTTEGEAKKLQEENQRIGVIQLQLQEELSETSNELKNLRITRDRLLIEKRDLMTLNNELQAKVADCQQALKVEQFQKAGLDESYKQASESSFQDFYFVENQVTEPLEKKLVESKGIRDLLTQLYSEQEKVSTLNQEIAELRQKNILLEETLKTCQKPAEVVSTEKPMAGVMEGLKASGEKFSMANIYIQRYKDRCDSLENWLGVYQDRLDSLRSKDDAVIEQLRVEITNLRSTLTKEQGLNQEDKRNLIEARKQFEILLKDYEELLKSWETYQQEQTDRGQQSEAYYDIQIRNLNEQIDKLTGKLVVSEESFAAKSQEVADLKQKIEELTQQLETFPILHAQVEVYKNDFRAERESREKMHQEREHALAEVRSLQIRNQQLVDELEAYQRSQFVEFQGRPQKKPFSKKAGIGSYVLYPRPDDQGSSGKSTSSSSSSKSTQRPQTAPGRETLFSTLRSTLMSQTGYDRNQSPTPYERNQPQRVAEAPAAAAAPPPDESLYYCPKCELGFTELQPLQNHVEACLDNNSLFL